MRDTFPATMKAMVLLTDGFGGYGGIAKFNRDLLEGLCADGRFESVLALPRLQPRKEFQKIPEGLDYRVPGRESRLRYGLQAALTAFSNRPIDVLVCAHIHLLPLARFCARLSGSRLLLVIHGIDAWQAPGPRFSGWARSVDQVWSVSQFTADRFTAWSGFDRERCRILPNVIDLERFKPGPDPRKLRSKLSLEGCRVLLTVGRLESLEQTKGFDETITVLARLRETRPDLHYLIMGEGDDRERLVRKAVDLGVADLVQFVGYVSEEEKADYYRLANLYVMPSSTEGFGITFLEALACGVPVIGGDAGGSTEVLTQLDRACAIAPADCDALEKAIVKMLELEPGEVPPGLAHYTMARFQARIGRYLDEVSR